MAPTTNHIHMKKTQLLISLVILLAAPLLLIDCKREQNCFQGRVIDFDGNPISGVTVSLGGREAKSVETSKDGMFSFCVPANKRYVLNFTRIGFGLASKVLTDTTASLEVRMTTATIAEVDPMVSFRVTDTEAETTPPLSAELPPLFSPLDTIPFVYDGQARLVGFGAPLEVSAAYDAVEQFTDPASGATIEVEGNSLEEAGATAALFQDDSREKITASISTINMYSPDGMPGDMSVQFNDGSIGFMETFGAADINFYRNGKSLQLKQGKKARLIIPIDTVLLLYYGKKLPEKIPLLVYNKNSGYWERDADREYPKKEKFGYLNESRTAYVAEISHFSVYNMDEEFMNPSCLRLCNSTVGPDNIPTTAEIEVAVGGHVNRFNFTAGCTTGCSGGRNAHAIARMKTNQPIGVRFFEAGQVRNSYVFIGGTPSPDVFGLGCTGPIGSCTQELIVSWVRGSYMHPSNDGRMSRPIIAVQDAGSNVRFSWVYISGPPPTYTNPATSYVIEFAEDPAFTIGLNAFNVPGSSTEWHNSIEIPKATIDGFYSGTQLKVRVRTALGVPPPASDAAGQCYGSTGLEPCS